jgi:sterol desaturase/sphingolipid hydroxylase (fatty acid hydroxylase superfamily)
MIDADQLHRFYNRLWVYFVDGHLLGQPALILLGVLLLICGEALFREWEKTTMYRLFFRRSMSAKIDIVYYLIQTAGIAAVLELVFSFGIALGGARLADFASDQLSWARITLPSDGIIQIAFSFTVFWIVSGFFGYWIHRLYHSPIFWQVHRFHHAAPELNFITAYRLHPLESFSLGLKFLSPMMLIRVPDSVILVSVVAGNFINFCQHSELPWDWGWIGRWIFGSPLVHQLHHSIDEEHRDTNFGNCPLWDHVFGTWYDGSKKPSAYGIPDPAYERQPFRQFLRDGWIFYTSLAAFLLQPIRRAMSWTRPSSDSNTSLEVQGTHQRLMGSSSFDVTPRELRPSDQAHLVKTIDAV